MHALLDARGDDADDALVPVGVEERDAGALAGRRVARVGVGQGQFLEVGERLLLHTGLDLLAFAVERVELLRDAERAPGVVGDQALDAERHVGQPPGGARRGPTMKPRSVDVAFGRVAAGGAKERGDARVELAGAHAAQPLVDQDAVVAVERYDVGDGAQRDQVEQRAQVGLAPPR